MLRSLFTGISGLTAHQQMLDVTANNIANINTVGYKSSRTAFQDTLSETMQGAAAPRNDAITGDAITGGTNAIQIGLGVKLAGTAMDMGQGSNQATGVGTDLMINGDGMFVVQKGGTTMYTRAGGFHLDSTGQLVTADGAIVAGATTQWDDTIGPNTGVIDPGELTITQPPPGTDPTTLDLSALLNGYVKSGGTTTVPDGTPITDGTTVPAGATIGSFVSYTIDSSGSVNAVTDEGAIVTLGQITMANFPNPMGLEKAGNSQYVQTAGSGEPAFGAPGTEGNGDISAGYLEMSNVDLAAELTNLIIAERGFQANSKSVTTSDSILQTLVNLKR